MMASFPSKKPPPPPLSQFIPHLKSAGFDAAFKKEIYYMFHRYILRPKVSKMWGFPFVDEDGKVRYNANHFSRRQQESSDVELCRCGKQIFLQGKNWHLDEKGCEFHPGKVYYSDERNTEIFSCCSRVFPSSGCARRSNHVSTIRVCHEDEFVKTVKKDGSYLPGFPNIFALDCEMVYTTKGMEVVKVTVMTVFCDVVYDTFVKPRHPVIDYNTEFSGISESHLAGVTVELKQVQADLLQLFDTDTILVGHGLENDLLCLNLYHSKVIDTSVLFHHSKGYPFRHSLKTLASKFLQKRIHCSSKGHDSREDARICIELVALKVFYSKNKEMRRKSFLLNLKHITQGPPHPPFPGDIPNKAFGVPNFGPCPPMHPMPWDGYSGYRPSLPPPSPPFPPHANYMMPRHHPLLSYPLYLSRRCSPVM